MNAVAGIDKPSGMTSFDVVSKLRKATHVRRIGHTGTLDPDATGVLVICFGAATRLASRLTEGVKAYEAAMFIGKSTDTADSSGRCTAEDKTAKISVLELEEALKGFTGDIMQVPPMYSALKVQGRKLYDLARAGQDVTRAPRMVRVLSLKAHAEDGSGQITYGSLVKLDVECSQGTYIRTLCEDIGKSLGVPAHMHSLRRVRASGFSIAECIRLDEALELASRGRLQEAARPMADAVPGMPKITITEAEQQRASCGNELLLAFSGETEAMLIGPNGKPVAIAKARCVEGVEGKAVFSPVIVFNITEDY